MLFHLLLPGRAGLAPSAKTLGELLTQATVRRDKIGSSDLFELVPLLTVSLAVNLVANLPSSTNESKLSFDSVQDLLEEAASWLGLNLPDPCLDGEIADTLYLSFDRASK